MVTQVAERAEGISWRELWILLAGRLVFNTAFRIVYPLLTLLASGLGVTLQTASLLVTVQVAASMLSPLGGVLADARGERTAMLTGLTLLTAGTLVCALAPGFEVFLGGYVLVGLGTALFMPSVQAYASHRSAYGERGRVLGFLEMSWALAALVGVAGLTQLVDLGGSWGPAFLTIAAMGGVMLALTLTLDGRRYEAPRPAAQEGRPAGEAVKRPRIGAALLQPEVAAAMGFVVLQMFAVELIFVAYAGWLSQDFGASTTQLGLVFGLLGVAELAGSVGATLLTDKLGKRRSVLLGFLATGLLILALPSSSGSWWLFLVLFLLFGVCFEFAIVSVFPLVSGLGTGGRGAVLALAVAAASLGRVGGSLIGPRLFEGAGFGAIGITAGITALIGVAIGVALLREGRA